MNKEEILKLSQQENKGKPDELELNAMGNASRAGIVVGAILCLILMLVGTIVLNRPEISFTSWMIYTTMLATSELVLYSQLKSRTKLFCGIMHSIAAIACAVALVSVIVG